MFLDPDLPRESQEARQGSQETPKETPKGVQNLVKKWLKSEPKNEQTKHDFYAKNIAPTGRDRSQFLRPWGLLKTLTSKTKKNGPKMIQKWFKIAQIA